MTNDKTTQPVHAESKLTGCNCRWDGETQVQWCELHAAHKEAIHDWSERAKEAEEKLAAPQPEAQPQWISVEERLPPINTEVLVAFDGISLASTGQYTGHPKDKGGWCYPSENYGTCDDGGDPKVTHWMPLPSAPSAQAEPTACPHTGQCHPGFCQCSDVKRAEQGGSHG